MQNILHTYEAAFGQAINFQKSRIFFSENVSNEEKNMAYQQLGVSTTLDHGKYLRFLSLVKRNKK